MSELIEKRFEKGGRYFVSPQLEMCPHVGHGFFTREGGVSKGIYESLNFRYTGSDDKALVEQNFKRAAEQIGRPGGTELQKGGRADRRRF